MIMTILHSCRVSNQKSPQEKKEKQQDKVISDEQLLTHLSNQELAHDCGRYKTFQWKPASIC